MADDVTCPACDEHIPLVASRAKGVKCPACGTQVLKPDPDALAREAKEAEEAKRAEKAAKAKKARADKDASAGTKIKAGSAPRKRRDDDDDDYDHDHPQERRPRRSSGGNGGVIAGLVLTVLVVIGIGAGVVYWIRGDAKPKAPPEVAGPNQNPPLLNPIPIPAPGPNPNFNPNPGPNPGPIFEPPPGPLDTSAAEKALPTVEPPFDVDPLLEKPARPVYLADMTEFAVRMGPWQFGKGELGNGAKTPIKVKGVAAEKGLSVHPSDRAVTRVAYALGGKAGTLAGKVGLSDPSPVAWNPVVFVIVGDGKELWRSGPIKGDTAPESFRVDVAGVKVLELRAVATGSHYGAHAAWLDPVIEK